MSSANQAEASQRQLTAASAYLESGPQGARTRGTGYLLTADLVATCSHVVPESAADGPIRICLEEGEYEGYVVARDKALDCALVRLQRPTLTTAPLPLGAGCAVGEPFWSLGFPLTTDQSRLPLSGHVVAASWPDPSGAQAILLFSAQVAAGQGGLLQGFSGSPVLIAGVCVGHLKSIIPDPAAAEGRPYAQLGYLYACPSPVTAALAAALGGPGCPPRQAEPSTPTRPSLRNLINKVTQGDANFDDFFQNHFEKIYKKHIGVSMSMVQKINILLTYADLSAVLSALRQDYPAEVSAHEVALQYESRLR